MEAERPESTETQLSWQQVSLFPCGPYKARLEVWNPQQDNDDVLVSVEFRDGQGHLVAMKVGTTPRTEGDLGALALGLEWYGAFWDSLHDPFDARSQRPRRK